MRKLVISLVLLLMISLPQYSVFSQQQGQIDKLDAELERTDEIIERAREIVLSSKSSIARLALEQGSRLQENAWSNYHKGSGYYRYSLDLTLQARKKAQDAFNAARLTTQNESVVLRKLERAEELLDRVHQALIDNPNNSLAGVYRSARDNLDKAWELYRSNYIQGALKLADQVERTLQKLKDLTNQMAINSKNYRHRMEMLRGTIERAADLVNECDSENARKLMEQAREKFQLAESMASENRYKAALKTLQLTRELTSRATSLCQDMGALENRYQRLKEQTDRLAEQIDPGNEVANRLLTQIRKQLELARKNLNENNNKAAIAALKAAQLTFNRLKKELEKPSL